MPKLIFFSFLLLALVACRKDATLAPAGLTTDAEGFALYVIPAGEHYSTTNPHQPVDLRRFCFEVRFDSSAIYSSRLPENQYDINKLAGFSDNEASHHAFSARYGWRWSGNKLRLFGYVYNRGQRTEKELASIAIGTTARCTIEVTSTHYRFITNGRADSLPRAATTPTAKGYRLYPYFGGDEPAPHEVRIRLKMLP
jgi:hypothetical protein